jgi:LmbE family N-acetylglucosaminyl deacetylase
MVEARAGEAQGETDADLLVLSPHLDDAALSVGGHLARVAAEGARVLVATLYTSGPPPRAASLALRAFADFERRRAEDAEALTLLGARPRWLGHVERAFRPPALRHPLQTFATPDPREGWPHLDELQRELDALLAAHPRARVLVPLAVGHHVDHVAVLAAACRALAARGELGRARFYEDSYALSSTARRAHFVTAAHRTPWWRWHELVSPWAAGLSFIVWAGSRGTPPERWLPPGLAGTRWRLVLEPLGEWGAVKEQAVRRYASQLGALGGGDGYCRLLARQAALLGGAEATWVIDGGAAGGGP